MQTCSTPRISLAAAVTLHTLTDSSRIIIIQISQGTSVSAGIPWLIYLLSWPTEGLHYCVLSVLALIFTQKFAEGYFAFLKNPDAQALDGMARPHLNTQRSCPDSPSDCPTSIPLPPFRPTPVRPPRWRVPSFLHHFPFPANDCGVRQQTHWKRCEA